MKREAHDDVTELEGLVLCREQGSELKNKEEGGERTGSSDCTNSLTMPPRNKQTKMVNINGQWRQNHIRRYSLWRTWVVMNWNKGGCSRPGSLLHIEYEVEDSSRNSKAKKVQ